MGWLEDLNKERIYNYRCNIDSDFVLSGTKEELNELVGDEVELKYEPNDVASVLVDGEDLLFTYAGFDPIKTGLVTKIVFEKNGRKGLRIVDGDGKQTVRSMSRENLLKGKGVTITGDKRDARGELTGEKSYEVDSILTKACRAKSDEVKKEEVYKRVKGMEHQVRAQIHQDKENKKRRK